MIRMSLDKETVLPRDVRGDAAVPEGPASGGGGGVDRVRGVFPPGQQQRMGKRRYSLGGSFKHPGFGKRRRRANSDSQSDPVLPSNFLLGGNIFDPLNLNSLLDEEVSRELNAKTPKSSPLPARARDPVEILVPRDITDPLNLKSGGGEGEEGGGVLVSPMKNRKRHRNRHHGGGGVGAQPEPPTQAVGSKVEAGGDSGTGGEVLALFPASVSVTGESDHSSVTPTPATAPPNTFHTPLVPGSGLRGQRSEVRGQRSGLAVGGQRQPQNSFRHKSQKKKNRFQHGNYSRYYGYRDGQVGQFEDPRLGLLRPDWFRGKTVLDIGCSTGHLTLAIARHFNPAHILGIDVDGRLVHAARQNIRHFLSERLTRYARGREEGMGETEGKRGEESKQKAETSEQSEGRTQSGTKTAGPRGVGRPLPPFPLSFRVCRGPIAAPPLFPPSPLAHGTPGTFPNNVSFITVRERVVLYDVIIHLYLTR
uniref:RNA methyltransferase n=1 Tax=Hucho hucho TaxID=62062 RepID=A0A4W5K0H9_9TELE